ncbi:hypothetical protein FRC14_000558 [Serendipita sp. 396]|nr:hypothetical protein FRC14_000558 [Serendipita sp. 396]KAG8788953.1 hypothetical protein FRC15_000985 [Serendipita sp. 397]KAG8804141.1 hypothetical protein FRC16_000530 [Serendipita sp. 398]KAG8811762.1 hypothetical protein FRC19_003611 [Serendipita sp. 401]KAG8876886.1 hypothetical protein FRC20_000591 [Serendipita sp. 405]KAG9034152.1 hypothetical protein FS842_003857 [Serendipita sp. 407]
MSFFRKRQKDYATNFINGNYPPGQSSMQNWSILDPVPPVDESDGPAYNGSPVNETDQPLVDYSDDFPPGYGDLQIVSSDGVIFHFHRWLLEYMSPVLRNMLRTAEINNRGGRLQDFKIQEYSTDLTNLLKFFDPKMMNPTLDYGTLTNMLDLGARYEITKLIDWIKTWMSDNLDEFFTFNNDMYTALDLFKLAKRFRMKKLAQGAFRVLIKAPNAEVDMYVKHHMPDDYYKLLVGLRHNRVKWFQEEIKGMLARGAPVTLLSGDGLAINDTEYIDITRTVVELAFAIASEPSYDCLVRKFPQSFHADYFDGSQAAMEELRNKALVLEAELPPMALASDWDD